jgi:hypothetical protein
MWRKLLIVLAAIFAIELVWLILDPTPSYFFGDSESYLATAVIKYIPEGRSFLYGLLIRRVALHLHSLEALIYLQIFVTGIAAWLVSVILCRVFQASLLLSALCGVLCAIEPLQLLMERYVMTEAAANFLFALHFFLLLLYLRRGRLAWLLVSQAVGVLLIGIRISFLPEVLINSVLAPLLSPSALLFYRSAVEKVRERAMRFDLRALRTAVIHLLLCLAVSQGLLDLYKNWYGRLLQRPPALLYENGAFLACDLAPLIGVRDFPDRARGQAVLRHVQIDLKNLDYRPAQHFSPEGLWHAIQTEYPNEMQANSVALRTAMHALFRQPAGALELAFRTFESFFALQPMKEGLLLDEGTSGGFNSDTVVWLRDRFSVPNLKSYQLTWTKRWHQAAIPWYWTILAALAVSPVLLFAGPREFLPLRILVVVTALLFLEGATLTAERADVRYLTSAAWLVLLMLGLAAQTFVTASARRR